MQNEQVKDFISQGVSLMVAGNYEQAKEMFRKAVDVDAKDLEARNHFGNACANLGQYEEAISAFKSAIMLAPESAELYCSLGGVYALKSEYLKAIKQYNKAEALGYKTAELYQMLSGIFMKSGDTVQAVRYISLALAIEPLRADLYLLKVRMYLSLKKYEEAMEVLEEFQTVLPDAYEAYDLMIQLYMGQKKYKEALVTCDKATVRFSEDANVSFLKLRTLVEMECDKEALAFVDEMRNKGFVEPILKSVAIQEMLATLRVNGVEAAIEVLLQANQQLENDEELVYLILDLYGKTLQYKEVLQYAAQLLTITKNEFYQATALYFKAYALDELGEKAQAKEAYRQNVITLRRLTIKTPSFYEGYIYRLLSHTKLGEFEKALELADFVENMHPNRADGHAFRSVIYREQGDFTKAEKEQKLAKAINPDFNM